MPPPLGPPPLSLPPHPAPLKKKKKSQILPRNLGAIHQQLFQGCEKSMCSALQTVHNDGGWKERSGGVGRGRGERGRKKKLNCNRIDLFKYNNTALCSSSGGEEEEEGGRGGGGGGSGGQTKTDWQQRADKLLQTRDTHRNVV